MVDLYALLDKSNLLKDFKIEVSKEGYRTYSKAVKAINTGLIVAVAGLILTQSTFVFVGLLVAIPAVVIKGRIENHLFREIMEKMDKVRSSKLPSIDLGKVDNKKLERGLDTPKSPKTYPIDFLGGLEKKEQMIKELTAKNNQLVEENKTLKEELAKKIELN